MEWLAAQPVQRTQIVVERFVAITLVTAQAALPATILLALGGSVGELDIGVGVVIWSMVRVIVLVALLAGLVMVISAATGSLELSAGMSVLGPVVAFGLIVAGETTAKFSPVRWALGATPAAETGEFSGVAATVVRTVVLLAVASFGFQRRDIIL